MKKLKGFTLIEVIIYIALFGVLMGGVATAVYAIIESAGRSQSKIFIQEEGNFLLGKFNWALSGASGISIVASPPSLTITKYSYTANPLVFDVSGNELRLKQGASQINNLNSNTLAITNLNFLDIPKSNGRPEGLTISFSLTGRTSGGAQELEDFQITKYLWQ